MVIVSLIGGLGNQLFQYALGRCISHKHQVSLKVDNSWYHNLHQGHPLRSYKLNYFNISADVASPEEIRNITGKGRKGIPGRWLALIQRYSTYYRRPILLEKSSAYDPTVFFARKNVYIKGYWHSEKYFRAIGDIIRNEFTLKGTLLDFSAKVANEIRLGNSVSLHVRRGDYVQNPRTRRKYHSCSEDYYLSAINRIYKSVDKPIIYVFSDDFDWVMENMNFPDPVVFVNHLGVEKDYEALYLMSLCKHHIIANSSFSWWGAWLGVDPEKIVIAPRIWFNDPERDTRDLVPDRWLRI